MKEVLNDDELRRIGVHEDVEVPMERQLEGKLIAAMRALGVTRAGRDDDTSRWSPSDLAKDIVAILLKDPDYENIPCQYCGSTETRAGDDVHPGYTGWPICAGCGAV